MKLRQFLLCISFLTLVSFSAFAKQVPPRSNTLVTDYAQVLSSREKQALERKLVAYNDSTSTQIAVVLDQSLEGEDIFDYSVRLAEAWGIGNKGKDNGILIYVAMADRELFIQTGYGAEGFLPDALAKRIIDQILRPYFRNGQYYQGLDESTNVIMDLGTGEYTAEDLEGDGEIPSAIIIFGLILLVVLIFSILSNNDDDDDGGYYRGGRYDYDDYGRRRGYRGRRGGGWIVIPGGGGGFPGGGGGGFGGGGFGGFGGGGFGGGGAGGSW